MPQWSVTVRVQPMATGNPKEDLRAIGGGEHSTTLQAADFTDAARQAQIFAAGIKRNPRVWRAEVVGLNQLGATAPQPSVEPAPENVVPMAANGAAK